MSVIVGSNIPDTLTGNSSDDSIYGFDGADSLSGLAGADVLYGGSGDDTLSGGDGDDLLDGGIGADRMVGGTGNDVFIVDNASDTTIETSGGGFDTVYSTTSYTLATDVEQLILLGSASSGTGNAGDNNIFASTATGSVMIDGGAGNDWIQGSNNADTILGGTGSDIIEGFGGTNRLEGGAGDDIFHSTSATDTVVELAGEGFDTLYANYDVNALAANVEQLLISGAATRGIGNNSDNNIFGYSSGNSLLLDGGNGDDLVIGSNQSDTIKGGAGSDTLEGLGGTNRLEGGTGNDVFYSSSATDTVIELVGEGFDTLYATYDVNALATNVEQLVVYGASTRGIGNNSDNNIFGNFSGNSLVLDGGNGNDWVVGSAQSDTIRGGAGADKLEGLGGTNRLEGGAGDDLIYSTSASDTVVELAGEGFDTLYANYDVNALAANVEQLVVYGASTRGIGNSGDNNIFGNASGNSLLLDGGNGNDWIVGSAQGDTILGGEGNDILVALGGGDSVSGGNGDDQVFGGTGADTLDGGTGQNRVWYSDSASGVNVSLASGTGSGGDAAGDLLSNFQEVVGSVHDDSIAGDNASNVLYGLGGADVLLGGGGDDSLLGGQGSDALNGDAGSDALFGEQGDDELTSTLTKGDTDFFFGGEGGESKGDIAVIEGNAGINTYLVGGNGLGFTYVGDSETANTFISDTETIDLVTGTSSDNIEIADGIGATGTHTLLVSALDGDDTVTVTATAPTGLTFLQVALGEGDDSFDFSNLEAGTEVAADGGRGNDSFQLHDGVAAITFDFQGSGGSFGQDNVIGFDTTVHELVFKKGTAASFQVLDQLHEDGSHLLTAVADGVTVGSVNVSGSFVFANDVVIS